MFSGQVGQDDQLSVAAVSLGVVDQAAVGEQADGVQRHAQRSAGRLVQREGVSGGKHVDAPGAELDRVGDRRVVGHPRRQEALRPAAAGQVT
ncbi:MAG: hypothetical protein ACRDSN_01325, partial [Pseudonocardiaceae bacterium]